ncbi:MAG: hypothetical protein GX447_06805 [Elusimicrobia bacterium]|nr:hypothetical protein [Elusimicrobiota bacterium]
MIKKQDIIYENHLRKALKKEQAGKYIAINGQSCYFINETTGLLIDILPECGCAREYLFFLKSMGIKNENKIFEKLISSGILIKKEEKRIKEILLKIISPDISVLNVFLMDKIFDKIPKIDLSGKIKRNMLLGIFAFFIFNVFLFSFLKIEFRGNGFLAAGLVVLGSIFHEIGHSYFMYLFGFGARPVGVFFYLIYPSLYVNMSGIERMKPLDKALANAGGFVFQSIYCAFLIFLYLFSEEEIFLSSYFMSVGLMIFNLNPFIRSDGYWLYKDFIKDKILNPKWKTINLFYLTASFMFTVYFSFNLLRGLSNIFDDYRKVGEIGFKDILFFYIGIISIKALARKIKEFTEEIGIKNNYNQAIVKT